MPIARTLSVVKLSVVTVNVVIPSAIIHNHHAYCQYAGAIT